MAKQSETNKSEYFKYLEFAEEFVKKQMKPFSSDDVKSEYLKNHLKPENHNVFSSVFVALSKKGAIKFNGNFVKTKFKEAHGRFIKEWISKEYSDIQSKKRISEETIKARELSKQQINLFQ